MLNIPKSYIKEDLRKLVLIVPMSRKSAVMEQLAADGWRIRAFGPAPIKGTARVDLTRWYLEIERPMKARPKH